MNKNKIEQCSTTLHRLLILLLIGLYITACKGSANGNGIDEYMTIEGA